MLHIFDEFSLILRHIFLDLDEYQANVNQTRIFSRQFAEICVDVTVYNGEVVRVQHCLNLLRKNVAQCNTTSVGYGLMH